MIAAATGSSSVQRTTEPTETALAAVVDWTFVQKAENSVDFAPAADSWTDRICLETGQIVDRSFE